MTRINCVPPSELSGKHLVAEYRELPRIFTLARRMADHDEMPPTADAPYILGTGHMKSFTGRLSWLNRRFGELVEEMINRGYKPTYSDLPHEINNIPDIFWHDWKPTAADMEICRARLRERIPEAYK